MASTLEPAAAPDRLARLFDTHQRRLFFLALRMASDREEAQDLVQEAFLRAARLRLRRSSRLSRPAPPAVPEPRTEEPAAGVPPPPTLAPSFVGL